MQSETINPDCEIEQLLFHMKISGIRPISNHGLILLWLEKKGSGDYSVREIAQAIGLSVRRTSLAIKLVCCTINATKMKNKYNILVSGKTDSAVLKGPKLDKRDKFRPREGHSSWGILNGFIRSQTQRRPLLQVAYSLASREVETSPHSRQRVQRHRLRRYLLKDDLDNRLPPTPI